MKNNLKTVASLFVLLAVIMSVFVSCKSSGDGMDVKSSDLLTSTESGEITTNASPDDTQSTRELVYDKQRTHLPTQADIDKVQSHMTLAEVIDTIGSPHYRFDDSAIDSNRGFRLVWETADGKEYVGLFLDKETDEHILDRWYLLLFNEIK